MSVHHHFFKLFIKLHSKEMFQTDVWSKGKESERILSSSLTFLHYSLLTAISEIHVKYSKAVKSHLIISEVNSHQWAHSPQVHPQSNRIVCIASSWTRWPPRVPSNLNCSGISSLNYAFTFCRVHLSSCSSPNKTGLYFKELNKFLKEEE